MILSTQRFSKEELAKLKIKKMQELTAVEPPRKTITGSFGSE